MVTVRYTTEMLPTWRVLPDGSYARLSQSENVVSDTAALLEDMQSIAHDFRDVISDSTTALNEARVLVAAVRKDRRLRATTLRLVSRGTRRPGHDPGDT